MNGKEDAFDEIETALTLLRQQTETKQRFPKEVWDSIIQLAQTHPIQEVSQRLNISPSYLKKKIKESHKISSIDFNEITYPVQACANLVCIELVSNFGLKAKIQGPLSCLNFLSSLFER